MLFSHLLLRLRVTIKRTIIEYFLDKPEADLSIHNICEVGFKKYKAKINQYWTPLTALLSIRDRFNESVQNFDDLNVKFFTFHNNTIDFRELAVPNKSDSPMVLFSIGMYGEEVISRANFSVIKEMLASQHCLGIVGGIGNRALYIVGFQGDNFLVLDPHIVQPEATTKDISSFSARKNVKIKPYIQFNPCLCIAFLVRNRNDLVDFSKSMAQISESVPDSYLYVSGVQALRKWMQDSGYTADTSLGFKMSK